MLSSSVLDFSKDGVLSEVSVPKNIKAYQAAKIMLEKGVDSLLIEGTNKGVEMDTLVFQVKDTPALMKREAKTVMRSTPLVYEKNLSNAQNISKKNNLDVLPVVNESGKFVGTWLNGEITKSPLMVKSGTRIKLVVDKVLKNPVVVVDKKRNPVGIITKKDLLKLASGYKEYTAPIFYSGVEDLDESEVIKGFVDDTLQKVNKLEEVKKTSINLSKRGVWVSHIKLSTKYGTFSSSSESNESLASIKESFSKIINEVKHDKDKRVRFRQ